MPRKKTEVRVKPTAFAWLDDEGLIGTHQTEFGAMAMIAFTPDDHHGINVPVVIRSLEACIDLESRLKAAEAECKRLREQRDDWKRRAFRGGYIGRRRK